MTPPAGNIEVLSLRRVAARFLARNEHDGLDELNEITAVLFGKILLRYVLWLVAVSITIVIFAGAVVVAVIAAIKMPSYSTAYTAIAACCAIVLGATLLQWRFFQYGFFLVSKPRAALYPSADTTSAKNIDRFFSVVQRETSPRAFYYTRSGSKRFLDERYFYGSLRVLLLARHRWAREPVFRPEGMWFGQEIFIEADVAALIAQSQARPKPMFKGGGRPKVIDYESILLELIEQARLRGIKPGERGSESQLMALIHELCDPSDEHDRDIRVPEPTELRAFSKKVLAAVRKNRARQK